MHNRILILLSMLILLSGCAAHSPNETKTAKKSKAVLKKNQGGQTKSASQGDYQTTTINQLARFRKVSVEGVMNVSLHTGYSKPKVMLKGNRLDTREVKTYVNKNTLHVVLGKGYPNHGRVTAVIQANQLNAFSYEGSGLVKGTKLRSKNLALDINNERDTILKGDITLSKLNICGIGTTEIAGIKGRKLRLTMDGRPRVILSGRVALTHLAAQGNGLLRLRWVDTPKLTVRARHGAYLQLAGVVDKLDVKLWNNAVFKGRYLRTTSVFAKTFDHSAAKIAALTKQHTLAKDDSNIYYYNIADMQTNFMAHDGSVLDMREWPLYAQEEYDRYNKHIP